MKTLTSQFGLIEVTYSVYKGYAESLKDTSEFSWTDESWQFEQGVIEVMKLNTQYSLL